MIYLFHRVQDGKPFFYPVDLPNDAEVLPNIECNPGTVKVTTPDGRVVWSFVPRKIIKQTEQELRQSFAARLDEKKAQLAADVTKDPDLREFARMAKRIDEALTLRRK